MAHHTRTLSYTEVSQALTCEAAHAFAYTGRLTPDGSTLRRKTKGAALSRGSAWGAMVAAWHSTHDPFLAVVAMRRSLTEDFQRQVDHGLPHDPLLEALVEHQAHLGLAFAHYRSLCEPLPNLTRMEDTILVPIPSRVSKRSSSRYRYVAKIDGFTVDERDHEWIVEFKFFGQLRRRPVLERSRQLRWYAWARQMETGRPVVGVIVDERLNEVPKPPRVVKAKRKGEGLNGFTVSEATDQVTTPEAYALACAAYGVEPSGSVLEALRARVWQQRVRIPFLPSELREAGAELVSAAQLVRDLDLGHRHPIRNAQPRLCNSCDFREICNHPEDDLFVDQDFERRPPKRLTTPTT